MLDTIELFLRFFAGNDTIFLERKWNYIYVCADNRPVQRLPIKGPGSFHYDISYDDTLIHKATMTDGLAEWS